MRQHRPRLSWFFSTEFEHLTILGSTFCWENQRELGLGSLSLLWPQEHRHTNYQSTSDRRSCPTQQGCHFLPPHPLPDSFQFVGSGTQGWLESSDNSLLVAFQDRSSDSTEDLSEGEEVTDKGS